MKKIYLIILVASVSLNVQGQNFPACDSLVINCCTFNVAGPNTITLEATNYSSVLFDYPGFILFDNNMNIIASEQVNYFGIGTSPQLHSLNVISPLMLPFNGYINLYILFYDTLACSFPITIPDTTTGIQEQFHSSHNLVLYPNPVYSETLLNIRSDIFSPGNAEVLIFDIQGRMITSGNVSIDHSKSFQYETGFLPSGYYLIRLRNHETILYGRFMKM